MGGAPAIYAGGVNWQREVVEWVWARKENRHDNCTNYFAGSIGTGGTARRPAVAASVGKAVARAIADAAARWFFPAMERMEQLAEPPAMSPEEVAGEIRAMREERRAKASG